MFAIIMFNDSYVNIVTITFSALICIEILNVYTQINNYNMQMMLLQVCTAFTYFMSILLLKSYFETSYMDTVFFLKVGVIAMITWAPIQVLYLTMEWVQPSDTNRVMEHMREE